MKVNLIVARDEKNLIGNNGELPWNIPRELQYFSNITMGSILIVGRKTADSLLAYAESRGRAEMLAGRQVIVVTSKDYVRKYLQYGALSQPTLERALGLAKTLTTDTGSFWYRCNVFAIGGASIYQQVLEKDLVDIAYVTTVGGTHEGDQYFDYDFTENFQLVERLDETLPNGQQLRFERFDRKLQIQ